LQNKLSVAKFKYESQLSVSKYTKRCKINLALQNLYENKYGVAK
jgi:hypothetical protein